MPMTGVQTFPADQNFITWRSTKGILGQREQMGAQIDEILRLCKMLITKQYISPLFDSSD